MKKHTPGFSSITQRIVLVLVLIILPFNIISIIATVFSLQNARAQMVTSVDNLLELSMQQLSGRMNSMNDFFYNLGSVYPDFKLYREQGERTADLAMAESNLILIRPCRMTPLRTSCSGKVASTGGLISE